MLIGEMKCKTCKFCVKVTPPLIADPRQGGGIQQAYSECVFNPPQVLIVPTAAGLSVLSKSPRVEVGGWCGRWERKQDG